MKILPCRLDKITLFSSATLLLFNMGVCILSSLNILKESFHIFILVLLQNIISGLEEQEMGDVKICEHKEKSILSIREWGGHGAIRNIIGRLFETAAKSDFKITGSFEETFPAVMRFSDSNLLWIMREL